MLLFHPSQVTTLYTFCQGTSPRDLDYVGRLIWRDYRLRPRPATSERQSAAASVSVSPVFPHVMAIAIGIFVQTDGDLVGYTDLVSVPLPARQQSVTRGQRGICLKFLPSRICCLSLSAIVFKSRHGLDILQGLQFHLKTITITKTSLLEC